LFLAVRWRLRSSLGLKWRDESELVYRINRLPESTAPNQSFQFSWGKVEFRSASDLRGQYSEIFLRRHYAVRFTSDDPVIIDAGGNIGMSAIWFKTNYPKSKLTVYEADPSLTAVLARNLASANIPGVNLQNAAVWIEDGFVSFDNLGQDKGAIRPNGGIRVASVDLASHLPERVDLLKLDVEGAEYSIIERLSRTGAIARVQNLVAEFHVQRSNADAVFLAVKQLREAGMQVAFTSALGSWLGPADSAAPFEAVGKDQALMEVYAWR